MILDDYRSLSLAFFWLSKDFSEDERVETQSCLHTNELPKAASSTKQATSLTRSIKMLQTEKASRNTQGCANRAYKDQKIDW